MLGRVRDVSRRELRCIFLEVQIEWVRGVRVDDLEIRVFHGQLAESQLASAEVEEALSSIVYLTHGACRNEARTACFCPR
jgi:hypothetical protein